MSTQSLDSDIYDYGFILNSTALHEAAMSVLVTTIYGRWHTITAINSYSEFCHNFTIVHALYLFFIKQKGCQGI